MQKPKTFNSHFYISRSAERNQNETKLNNNKLVYKRQQCNSILIFPFQPFDYSTTDKNKFKKKKKEKKRQKLQSKLFLHGISFFMVIDRFLFIIFFFFSNWPRRHILFDLIKIHNLRMSRDITLSL